MSLNSTYLEGETVEQIKESFNSEQDLSSISLQQFFTDKTFKKLQLEIDNSKFNKETKLMEYKFESTELPSAIKEILNSKELIEFIESIIQKKIKKIDGKLYLFSHKDYALRTQEEIDQYEFIIDFSDWNEELGGSIIYVDEKGETFRLPSNENTVSIVHRTKKFDRFVKYVNHYAKEEARIIIIGKIYIDN